MEQVMYMANAQNFSKIPGSPIAYWANEQIREVFSNPKLYDFSVSPSQNITGNNDRFVRKWWELTNTVVNIRDKWIFYAKGGGFRKWWGNLYDIVNWTPEARYTYHNGDGKHASQIINRDYWYKQGITWGLITSSIPSFRVMPEGATFDKGGSTIIVNEETYLFALSLLNSKVYLSIVEMLNPTLNYQVKDIRNLPINRKNDFEIKILADKNIKACKHDWDSFETSWDFKKHPLI